MRSLLKTIPAIIFGLLLLTSTAFANFSDIKPGHEFSDSINYLKEKNIVEGYEDGSFKPSGTVTRAEFVKMLLSFEFSSDIDSIQGADCFSDVANEWFAKFICYSKEKNIIDGYDDGTFKPNQPIAFAEASKIIAKVMARFDLSYNVVSDDWHAPYIFALRSRAAVPGSIESPAKLITRGEMAEILYRLRPGRDVDPCSETDITDSYIEIALQNSSNGSQYCEGAALSNLLFDDQFWTYVTNDDLVIFGMIFANTRNNYAAIKVLKNIDEDLLSTRGALRTYNTFAQAYFQKREYDQAILYADKVLGLDFAEPSPGEDKEYKKDQDFRAAVVKFSVSIALQNVDDFDGDVALIKSILPAKGEFFTKERSILNLNPESQKAYLDKDAFYEEMGIPEVFEYVTNFFEAEYLVLFATINRYGGNYDYAREILTEALQHDPHSIEAYLELGRGYRDQGDYRSAIDQFEKALEIDPKYYKAHNLIGYAAYLNISEKMEADPAYEPDFTAALEYLNNALEMDPEYARPYNTMGVIFAAQEDHEKAVEYFLKALSFEDYDKPYLNASLSYEALGDFERALEYRKIWENM